jgi:hypothetical protein
VYKVVYYENQQGVSEVEEYINSLNDKTDKDSRIKKTK